MNYDDLFTDADALGECSWDLETPQEFVDAWDIYTSEDDL